MRTQITEQETVSANHISEDGLVSRIFVCVHAKSLQLCPTLCGPMNCSPPAPLSTGFSRQEYWSG